MPDYRKAATKAARKYGIDPSVFLAMINQESGFNPNARSGAGAQGIAQFMPGTAAVYGVNLNDGRATDDLEGAARYLRDNLAKTGGSYQKALSIYNSGRPDAYKDPGFAGGQTYNYVRNILAASKLGGAGGGLGDGMSPGVTTTTTSPGVDNSGLRAQLIAQFVGNEHDPNALTALAAGLLGAKDQPGSTSTTTTPGKSPTAATSKGKLLELFYQGAGGVDVKNGQVVPQGFVSGHQDHVHTAVSSKQVLAQLEGLAREMGLTITSTTGGQHAKGSFHYEGKAFDAAGDPKKMAAFAQRIRHMYGL